MLELSDIPLFSQLSPSDLRIVESVVKVVDFPAGATLCRKGDPGRPDICPVYLLHQIYTPDHKDIVAPCKSGELGCVDCKKRLTENLNNALEPIREKRKKLVEKPDLIFDILNKICKKSINYS